MNARVFLLVLMTGLFMALWNGDQAAMEAALARRSQAQQHMLSESRVVSAVQSVAKHQPADTAVISQATARMVHSDYVPLPQDLPPGDYQAVSQTGRTLRVSIHENSNCNHSGCNGRIEEQSDLFVRESVDGIRWFFVRIVSEPRL